MLARSKSERHGIFQLIIIISIACAALAFFILTVFSKISDSFSTHLDISTLRWLLTFALLLIGMRVAFRFLILKESAYRVLSIMDFCTAVVVVLSQLILSSWNKENGLLLGQLFSLLFLVVVSFYMAVKNRWIDFSKYSPKNYLRVLKSAIRNKEYPKYMTWSAICNSMTPQVIIFASNYLFNPAIVGQIFLAERILKRPTMILSRSLADTSLEEASNISRSRLVCLYKSRLKKMLLLGAVPFTILFFILPWAFPFIFGDSWHESGVYAQILVPSLYLRLVSSPFIPFFTVLRKQRIFLGWSATRLVFILVGVAVGSWVGGTRGAVFGYSVTLSIGYIFAHVLLVIILQYDSTKNSE
jgi:O-antigen/teichoic acid export membrane protein